MALGPKRKAADYDGDYDDEGDYYDDDDDSLEGKIVAAFLAFLAVGFVAFVVMMPYLDKDGSLRKAISGVSMFSNNSGGGGIGMGMGIGSRALGPSGDIRYGGLGPVDIGMTAAELEEKAPASFYRSSGGRLVANLRGMNAAYTAWFTSGTESGTVSRMRMDRLFPGGAIDDVVGYISKELGKPLKSGCLGATVSAGRASECTMSWKSRAGVTVNARLRQVPNSKGGANTTITMTMSK